MPSQVLAPTHPGSRYLNPVLLLQLGHYRQWDLPLGHYRQGDLLLGHYRQWDLPLGIP